MGTKTTQTQSTSIRGIGQQEQGARDVLSKLSGDVGQLGNLSELANGNVQLDEKDLALLLKIQQLSGDAGRNQLQQNFDSASSAVEGDLLARGLEGSSIEAVNKALLGRQLQQSLDQSAIQGQITTAQGARQQVFDKAGVQLNANQILLQRILGGAQTQANLGLSERLAQTSTTGETSQSGLGVVAGQLGQIGGNLAANIGTGGLSSVAGAVGNKILGDRAGGV